VAKVEEYTRIIKQNDTKAVEKDKKEASKVEDETMALYTLVELKDIELSEANARAEAEFKQKVLWKFSTAGLGLFVSGLLALAFSPFKKSAGIVMAGGMLAMASAWIFDSAWFTWVVAVSVGVSVIGIAIAIYKDKSNKASEQAANKEDKQKEPPVLSE
jgi:lipopolysaccharide export LptBFGC system permease protein LptF